VNEEALTAVYICRHLLPQHQPLLGQPH
jgi:hypothetical protein